MENEKPASKAAQTAEQTDRLLEVLHVLESRIERQNSYKNAFLKGMVYGLGTVIGATVLVALFGGVIAATLQTLTGEDIDTELLDR
jgi:hypothetical protein